VEDTPSPDTKECPDVVVVQCPAVEDVVPKEEISVVSNSTSRHVMLSLSTQCHLLPCPNSLLLLSRSLMQQLPPLLMSL
jgi:hypothetical protein